MQQILSRLWPRSYKKLGIELAFLACTVLVSVICLLPVGRSAGWPTNHDNYNARTRTEVYAEHFKQRDFVPVWSPGDGNGIGSPMPLYYQKTFYYVSGTLYLATDGLKSALIGAIALFMILGAYGMRAAVRRLTKLPWLVYVIPLVFIFSNYTFTNWLVRGATAEFSAAMLVPWLLWWCLRLLKDGQFSWWIVPIFVALFGAHNAIAMVAAPAMILAYSMFLYQTRTYGLRTTWKPVVLSGLAVVALLGPTLLAQLRFNTDYSPASNIIENDFTPVAQMRPVLSYFYDSSYVWLQEWDQLTVQIDYGIWLPLLAFIGLGGYVLTKRRGRAWLAKHLNLPVLLFLGVAFVAYLFMQFTISKPVYDLLHPLSLLQFPWRLLAFIAPLGFLLIVVGVDALNKRHRIRLRYGIVAAAAWLAVFVVLSPLTRQFDYKFYPAKRFNEATPADQPNGMGMVQGGEYVPITYDAHGKKLGQNGSLVMYGDMYSERRMGQALDGKQCDLTRHTPPSVESMRKEFTVVCAETTTYALPVSYSRYMRVYKVTDNGLQQIDFTHRRTDPRVLVEVTGSEKFVVQMPTLKYVLLNKK